MRHCEQEVQRARARGDSPCVLLRLDARAAFLRPTYRLPDPRIYRIGSACICRTGSVQGSAGAVASRGRPRCGTTNLRTGALALVGFGAFARCSRACTHAYFTLTLLYLSSLLVSFSSCAVRSRAAQPQGSYTLAAHNLILRLNGTGTGRWCDVRAAGPATRERVRGRDRPTGTRRDGADATPREGAYE